MNPNIISALIAVSLPTICAPAQQASSSSQPPQVLHHQHHASPHREAALLSCRLNLTPDQTAKIEPILADRDAKLAILSANTSMAPEAINTEKRSIRLDTQQKLSVILTPEQMRKFQATCHHRISYGQAPPTPTGF